MSACGTDALKLCPLLADYPIDFKWSGVLALTLDQMPRMTKSSTACFSPKDSTPPVSTWAPFFGKYSAKLVSKQSVDQVLLAAERFRRGRFPQLHPLGVEIVSRWSGLLDYFGH
jgi:gamma-glutamylputrescine oxidase